MSRDWVERGGILVPDHTLVVPRRARGRIGLERTLGVGLGRGGGASTLAFEALSYDGTDYASIPRASDDGLLDFGTGDWALGFWANPTNVAGYWADMRQTSGNGFFQIYVSSGKFALYGRNNVDNAIFSIAGTGPALSAGSWYNVTLLYNGTTRVFTLNVSGTSANSGALTAGTSWTTTGDLVLGAQQNGTTGYITGLITQVRIWKGTLPTGDYGRTSPWLMTTTAAWGFTSGETGDACATYNGHAAVIALAASTAKPTRTGRYTGIGAGGPS